MRCKDEVALGVMSTGFTFGSMQLGLLCRFAPNNLRDESRVLITPHQRRSQACSMH